MAASVPKYLTYFKASHRIVAYLYAWKIKRQGKKKVRLTHKQLQSTSKAN